MKSSEGKSFIATLHSTTPGIEGKIGISVPLTEFDFAVSGWLQVTTRGERSVPVSLRFDYLAQAEDRILYNIFCESKAGGYQGAKLGVSRNGYLGLYQRAEVESYWKVEPIGEDWERSNERHFILRTATGRRVKNYQYDNRDDYLNYDAGVPLTFLAKVKKTF
ncbi:hypothetical protein NVV94_11165 [Pseudomonas sp. LS1212]|uniref:hypothetical protein n=1 Tax=Pseudomonas sp. LS1212 TaxID=2972478 RepID=UPI00215CD584|nr:hypothetical protein [Pseudomonas sp. LS1212]UVJ46050.1 hypothetical protein NVV94_11165 [Pseudomonas sp. LS1212]